jgi:hypothetical protein
VFEALCRHAGVPLGGNVGVNRLVIDDTSAFGPIGGVVLLGVPLVIACAYVLHRVDVRHLALALALPVFLALFALQALWNPWVARFLIVPAALTAPLFARLLRDPAIRAAYLVAASIVVALTLSHDRRKPLESPYGPPWQLTQGEAMKPQGGGAHLGVVEAYDRLVPPHACVGAVMGPDEPSYLLYRPDFQHRVFYLPVENAVTEAYARHLFYVVISAGVNSWAAPLFTKEGWKLEKLGEYWLLVVSPASGSATGDCHAA